MANENAGGIYYEVGADVADLLTGAGQANRALDDIGRAADKTSGKLKNLDSSSRNTGKAVVRAANDSSQAAKTMEALGNEIAVLEERNKNGARSAAILSAELRAGAGATAAQRKEIGQLTGQLYDLKNAQDQGTKSSSGLKTGLTAIAAAISIAQIVSYAKAFLDTADAMTQLQARIDRLSPSMQEGAATFQSLAMIASTTGASLQETSRLWEQLTSSLKGAGATNGQVLALTDTLQKIGKIGGSSTEEMSNALRQFGQSISSGTIRAEEFNSILEQMPELARQIAAGLGISAGNAIGELRKRMLDGKLTAEDALNAIMSRTGQVNAEFEKLPRTTAQAMNSLQISFEGLVKQINDATGASTTMVRVVDSLTDAIDRLSGKSRTASQSIADLTSTGEMYARRARTWSWLGLDGWEEQNKSLVGLSNRAIALVKDMDGVSKATANAANNKPLKISSGTGGDDKATQKLEKNTKRKLELSRLEGEARARLQAQYDAEDAGIKDSARIKALQDEYAATERNTSARKAGNSEAKKAENQQAAINKKLEEMRQRSDVSAESTAEMARQQAILRAQQSLGEGATQEQIRLAGELAAKTYDATAALKAQADADKARQQIQKQFDQLQKSASPTLAADDTFKQQMLTIEQYKAAYPKKIAEAEAARAAIEKQYREQRINLMWAEWEQQSTATQVAGAAFDAFGQKASNALTGILTGTMSIGDAMRSIGNTILDAVIDTFVQMGIQWAKSAILGATTQQAAIATTTAVQTAAIGTQTAVATTAAATTAAAWTPAALLASIASLGTAATIGLGAVAGIVGMSLLGKRKNGGPVTAGGMYQVGEGGMPEIFQASNGRQYMIPGDNGSVISNKDIASGGSGIVIYNNVTNNSSAQVSTSAQDNGDGTVTINTIVADINEGGPIGQAISNNYTTSRRATD